MDSSNISNNQKEGVNIGKYNGLLCNINSKYILQKIFENMSQKKSLTIIKNNKIIQQRLDISIDTYKEYFITYTTIEIEIIPIEKVYGKFINISKKEDEQFFHIYFDNNKEELKKYELNEDDKINSIKIIIDHQIKSFSNLFEECKCIKSITFKRFNRNNVIDMNNMFTECSSLEEINFSNFNTENVNNMSDMFCLCQSLKQINVSKFNTENVTDMSCMFSGCYSLKELDLSKFNTKNVKNMNMMFYQCKSLEKLNISNFNTINVTDMGDMFCLCTSLKEINISNFNTNNVKNMNSLFYLCILLEKIQCSNFNIENVTDMKGMFSGCQDEFKTKIKNQIENLAEEAFE